MDKAPGRIQINSGKYKGTVLFVPDAEVRPTPLMVRQALFNSLGSTLANGTFLDLFSGSGAMALEALSRGCPQVTLVEAGRAEIAALRKSLEKLALTNTKELLFLALDIKKALALLHKQECRFRYIFCDPPFHCWDDNSYTSWAPQLAGLLQAGGELICQADKAQAVPEFPGLDFSHSRIYGRNALHFYQLPGENNDQ